MKNETALIVAQPLNVPANWSVVGPEAKQEIESAIAAEGLLARVGNDEENTRAQKARAKIKGLKGQLEKERKHLKEPLLEAGRVLDRAVALVAEQLDREDGRLENLQKEFLLEEQRRVQEEERKQRDELARIERERQEELKRIELETLEAERIAREAREAAERAERDAKNKKQREEAGRLRRESDARAAEAAKQAKSAETQTALINDNADLMSRAEATPISVTRAVGQVNKKKWKITSINDFQLMRARPDLVRKVEWDRVGITEALNAGNKLPGVEAEEDFTIGARQMRQTLVEV